VAAKRDDERATHEQRPARPPIAPIGAQRDRPGATTARQPLVRVAVREGVDPSRTSPRMRFDLLQVVAWALGLAFVVGGLVALARAGFDELALTDPVVEVAGQPATPLLGLVWLLLGVVLLTAGTGEVGERGLRIGGAMLAVLGAVWAIEPDAFAPYLGVEQRSGTLLLVLGAVLVAASFVPPLSIRRPGVPEG
jgi:hypothetical protein